ncbi:unnamed protein product [Blepharisma stoltei]|uniref:Uncharacterized protein n=1 Tax=Blepharisma stoltei TaxID=1481888 RepID=A0AAU9ID53_9CILI|nr:unnamed protein product [Blepharisma stoltei]
MASKAGGHMLSTHCEGCRDPVKRAILYSKQSASLCARCNAHASGRSSYDYFEHAEREVEREKAWRRKRVRQFDSCSKLRKYALLLSEQVGSKYLADVIKIARRDYKLIEKLVALHKATPAEHKMNLARAVKVCYSRDYTLEQVNNYLRPKGFPYENVAIMFQELYDNYISRK